MWSQIRDWLRGSAEPTKMAEAPSAFGLLGGGPEELAKTEFFQWFHLTPLEEARDDGDVAYSPSADSFRRKVALIFRRTSTGAARCIDLEVDRSLLDAREFEASARDIVKSFVLAVTSPGGPKASRLAQEIQFGGLQAPLLVRNPVDLPDQPSPVLNILLDRVNGAVSFDFERVSLWFDHVVVGEQRRLLVRAYPYDSPELAGTIGFRGAAARKPAT